MASTRRALPDSARDPALVGRLRAATEALEALVADRGLLAHLTAGERQRLLKATGQVYSPDNAARRRMVKATSRMLRLAQVKRDEAAFARQASGPCGASRCSTRPTSSHRPSSYSARRSPHPGPCAPWIPGTATSASRTYSNCTTSTTSCARRARRFNFAKRTELADLRGRVALLTGGRVKIGYQAGTQAAARRGAADRHHPLPARLGGPLCARARFRGVGRPARDLRPRPAAHAERRGVLPASARDARLGSTSSSTTPARRCDGRRTSTST